MSRKLMRPLMRQQSSAATHELYCVQLLGGGGGQSFSNFLYPPTDPAIRNFTQKAPYMITNLLKKPAETLTKEAVSKPASQPVEPQPIDQSPKAIAERAAEAAGYRPGDDVTGSVSSKRTPNPKLLHIKVPDWGELALCSVQNAADWSASERIKCRFVMADTQGRLRFENRDGIRRNRWRR